MFLFITVATDNTATFVLAYAGPYYQSTLLSALPNTTYAKSETSFIKGKLSEFMLRSLARPFSLVMRTCVCI